ncbi:NifB/NifX family molybdenum-iron cluster-binding protein [Desulfurobacterium sp.]|uniref:NifB/NifX family molybdenum-iron cluster-binding protein n=1 Tax=Desulfurobacterium sp. TaxID=2004706 RepID=UPI00262D055C|nr:NifB/NifX family molybdenum-iron cluster-binding protein [Desulfurobacterium sp.]
MIIAIPAVETEVNGKKLISPHFGKAPAFVIFNGMTGESMLVENPKKRADYGGGRLIADLFMRNGVDAVLVKEMGEGAFFNLQTAGIKVFLIPENIKFVEDAISLYNEGKLQPLTQPSEGGHHH